MKYLKKAWDWLKDLAGVLKPCRFSVIMLGLVLLFFLLTEPGEDLLRSLAEVKSDSFGSLTNFFSAMIIWALNAWYWARVMLRFRFDMPSDNDPKREKRRRSMRKHVPRILGLLAFIAVGIAFGKASTKYDHAIALLITCFVFAAIFYGFTAVRRKVVEKIRAKSKGQGINTATNYVPSLGSYRELGKGSLLSLALSMSLAAVLFMLFWRFPQSAPFFGSATIVLLAAATWIPFGSMLVYVGSVYKFPVITLLFVLLVVFSFVNDNHTVRTIAGYKPNTKTVQEDFKHWLTVRMDKWPKGKKQPVFVVAAEGGGIRAAYWSGIVLAALQDRNPEFADHIYAISGVSGGSLGAAVFTALAKEQKLGRVPAPTASLDEPMQSRACAILSDDFLAPATAFILYPDLVQRFLPVSVPWFDRSRAIEGAWEKSWTRQMKSTTLSDGFHTLWADRGEHLPALFLNSTWVESGKRAIASNFRIDSGTFNDAVDLFGTLGAEMRLSSAVHNSARFTYVSPAGTIKVQDEIWGHLVDGGYFDNSGGSTAIEILGAMEEATPKELWGEITPVVIMITNDPRLDDGKEPCPYSFMNEIMSPIRTFFNTRPARASYSRSALNNWAYEKGIYLQIGLDDVKGPLPLSWVLSDVAKKTMQDHLDYLLNTLPGKRIDPVSVDDLKMLEGNL